MKLKYIQTMYRDVHIVCLFSYKHPLGEFNSPTWIIDPDYGRILTRTKWAELVGDAEADL